jgi:PmbA protein
MVADCERIGEHLRAHCDGEVDVFSTRELTGVRLRNTAGFDAATQVSEWTTYAGIRFPGTHASLWKAKVAKGFDPLGDNDLADLAGMHARSGREVRIAPGRMKVMFVPQSMYTLMWRLRAATDGRHVYERVSPLVHKLGDSVFDSQLTIEDRPLDDARPGARAFDDEGTPCADRSIVEEGVLRGYCFDRTYAWRAGVQPTGNGYRSAIDRPVAGTLRHLRVLPGRHSTAELLSEMGRGVVVVGALGAHSGNILHGDYSIGLAPGLYVEGGEIVGRVKDAMLAGNIYETMRNVVAVGSELEPGESGWYPPIVFDDVRVSVAS